MDPQCGRETDVLIRRAKVEDIEQLMVMAKAYQLLTVLAEDVFLVAEEEGKILGVIGGKICPNFWDPSENHLAELFWWVAPEHRKGSMGLKLMDAFEEVGRILKVTSVVMVSTTLTPTLKDVYERKGYTLFEESYRKVL
jgi:N-acetylglutamate synthase-like GNAT family acetyltransferase